jgi:hypothetical protein
VLDVDTEGCGTESRDDRLDAPVELHGRDVEGADTFAVARVGDEHVAVRVKPDEEHAVGAGEAAQVTDVGRCGDQEDGAAGLGDP